MFKSKCCPVEWENWKDWHRMSFKYFCHYPKPRSSTTSPVNTSILYLRMANAEVFSIANQPQQAAEEGIEIHIRHVPDGHFTPRVFDSMKERDLLRFEGPFGTYFLQSEPETEIIMVAGGTGFSPIKGLFEQAVEKNPDQKIHLFWGARDQQDLYMDTLVNQWTSEYPNFRYTPVLSENTAENWQGETGFVHESVCRHYDDVSKYDVYASGPPIMIDSVRDSLTERELNLDRFLF